ncbi:gliding motility-associated C-terminal domain-containing protein [Flavobacterium sp.]|uniref:T9SS type B sorting domain-containing protein n=1 Tax=Flavobacterium sp. TaxID=239 RepID=UPI0026266B43|nr:gliding motility-associated C-terminal domain-containing protein [Flavobacterium sp.]MDG2431067.1 gliding motility-associated C-terminal domain-containing protein [Flavobacterium sp.]
MIKKYFYFVLIICLSANSLVGQLVIAKPTFVFLQACSNANFNTFEIQINFSASPSLNSNNQFIIELSDPAGSFLSPSVVYTTAIGEITASGQKVIISFPITTSGEKYQLRVRSTIPAVTGDKSNAFAAYYKAHDEQFTINNTVATASYCAGGNYTLRIDPDGNTVSNSPLKYPSLTYNWYRDNGTSLPKTLVLSAGPGNYTVTQPGTYFVETNYGTCTSNSYSNRVQVTESTTAASASITSSKGNPFCIAQGPTILSVGAGNSYQWFKDDVPISGATSQTYQATTSGKYSVKVDYGSCQASAFIQLQEFRISSTINVPPSNSLNTGETLGVTVTTDASSPTFQWFLNSKVIANATTNNYTASSTGNYKIIVTQNGSCTITNELFFEITGANTSIPTNVPNIPNLISANNDGINDTWVIPQDYSSGSNSNVTIISSNGEIVMQTNNYLNDWPNDSINVKNINPVYYYIITTQDNQVIKGSITVIK